MPNVTVNGVDLHYHSVGEGENLVLIHGLGANLAFWYPGIASLLSRQYRVIVYDLRGHGRSEMPNSGYSVPDMTHDLQALLEHLGVARVHVVGHSFGARIAVRYATLYPEQVATLTLADTRFQCLQPKIRLREWSYWETWKQELTQQGVSIPSDEEFISFHLLKRLNQSAAELNPDGLKRKTRKPTLRKRDMGVKGARQWEQLMLNTSAKHEFEEGELITEDDFRKIAMPTLAMYGEHSHCLASCWKLEELIQECEVAIIPNAGHFHPASKPKKFIDALSSFLQTHSLQPTFPKSLSVEEFVGFKRSTALLEEQR